MELNDSELEDIIGEVLITSISEMSLQIMISVRCRLQLCLQSGANTSRICVKLRAYALDGEDTKLQKQRPF